MSLRSSQSTCEKRTTINETASVGRGHVPVDREAADGRHEQVCTYLVVPTPAGTWPRPTGGVSGMERLPMPSGGRCRSPARRWRGDDMINARRVVRLSSVFKGSFPILSREKHQIIAMHRASPCSRINTNVIRQHIEPSVTTEKVYIQQLMFQKIGKRFRFHGRKFRKCCFSWSEKRRMLLFQWFRTVPCVIAFLLMLDSLPQ